MTDPFFMLILMGELGPGHTVWDKAATIRYRRPGRGTVAARFEISRARIEAIRSEVAERGRAEPTFTAEIRDAGGDLVAEVDRVISVRRRERSGRPA